jgi:hypothetical protein
MAKSCTSSLWLPSTDATVFGLAALIDFDVTKQLRIPVDEAEFPWDEFFGFFNRFDLREDFSPQTAEEGRWLYLSCIRPWILKLHWLYKKTVDQSHRIPVKPSYAKSLEYDANVLVCIREICKELHKEPEITEIYPNYGVWLRFIILDQILLQVHQRLGEVREKNRNLHKDPPPSKSKKKMVQNIRDHWLSSLHAGESPFKQENSESCPHWARFINLSLEKADPNATRTEKGNVFRQTYWKPYLDAESKNLTDKDRNSLRSVCWYEDGKVFSRKGRSKSKILVAKVSNF